MAKTDKKPKQNNTNLDEYTMAFNATRVPHKTESIIWLISSLTIFFLTLTSISRLTVIGQFIDDVFFSFIFGWYKYFVYLILICAAMCIFFGVKFKFKPRFLWIVFVTFVMSCFLISAILYTVRAIMDNIYWDKNIFKIWMNKYTYEWKRHSVFSEEFKSKNWIMPDRATYFNVWAGGGIVGLLLTSIFSYLSIFGALIIAIFCFSLNIIWIVKGSPFYYFVKKEKRVRKYKKLRIIKLKGKDSGQIINLLPSTSQSQNQFSDFKNADLTIEYPSYREQTLNLANEQPIALPKNNDEFFVNQKHKQVKNQEYQNQVVVKDNQNLFDFTNQLDQYNEADDVNIRSYNLFGGEEKLVEVKQVKPVKKVTPEVNNVKVKPNQFTIDNFLTDQDEDVNNFYKNNNKTQSVIEQFVEVKKEEVIEKKVEEQTVKKQFINKSYRLPSFDLLEDNQNAENEYQQEREFSKERANNINQLFQQFNVAAKVTKIGVGPTITKYEVSLQPGVKVSSVTNLENDLKFALGSQNIRLEAPIPGKSAVGIEVANRKAVAVSFKSVITNTPMSKTNSKLLFAIGKDVSGDNLFAELNKMPHLLTAGSTGSGKSVMINCLISSILMRAKPHEVKFIMVDPKKVELDPYARIPHLLTPVITDMNKASFALQKVVKEMDDRYNLFKESSTKNIESYNEIQKDPALKMPYIVVVVDELADLMMQADKVEVENAIRRITQMARAAGIHLIVATQRPSADVITGVIKANIPSRIAFAVTSGLDSRTILDQSGAEKLIGRGDLLYIPPGSSTLTRAQGAYISDGEIKAIVDHCASQQEQIFDEEFNTPIVSASSGGGGSASAGKDSLFEEVKAYVIAEQKASTSLLQRKFSIGYNKAAKLIDELEEMGIIGPQNGSKPREVYVKGDE